MDLSSLSDVLFDYLEYANSLEFDSVPDYDRCRKMFRDALLAEKHPLDGKLDFTAPKQKLKLKVGNVSTWP